ncbi:hypothetical protein NDS46_30340 (plasmid) [Paenibacillus thiaminolyticus]|uniref:hypothetical protein n=1 Tax=Paenibacillus thiaminolyticus TaxID=49283 RepID=UPI002330C137|nr:hypothetical protein [Paenibacillus thiaminolyticus]WCF11648.1 hypothetical protein NDS46_30340 [Paenibacillus thiaminolyticus]
MRKITSSVLSYPDRGHWGNNNYRGNCTGHIISDLIDFYKPRKFVEVFAGGGTGQDVCREKGNMNSLHLDLRPEFGSWNALRDEMPCGSDLVFSHPPYHNMIVYSGKVWGKEHPDDLSRCATYDEFISKLNLVNAKIYNSLRKGGRHAMLIGDLRRHGKYYSMIKDLAWYGDLEGHLIKVQHNTESERKQYSNHNFIPIMHEHLLIFRKGDVWDISVKITKTEKRNLMQSKLITWRDLVQSALEQLGGRANLSSIYNILDGSEKRKLNANWQEKIRQTLQIYDEFRVVKRGVWELDYNQSIKIA